MQAPRDLSELRTLYWAGIVLLTIGSLVWTAFWEHSGWGQIIAISLMVTALFIMAGKTTERMKLRQAWWLGLLTLLSLPLIYPLGPPLWGLGLAEYIALTIVAKLFSAILLWLSLARMHRALDSFSTLADP